jgi:hypothetical protein
LRKVLFGTSALFGAALLAGTAMAQTAGPKAPFTAILDGEANANFGVLSGVQNSGNNGGHARDFGMEQNAWMRFFFEAKADNGLTYGWNVRILGTSSTITFNGFSNDREGIYFRHDAWGTVSIGNDTATGKQGFPFVKADWGPPTSAQSYLGPDGKLEGAFLQTTDTRAFNIFNTFIKLGSDNGFPSGRAMHIWYGTPTFAGFSANMDYTPDGRSRNEEQFVTDTLAATPATNNALAQSLSATNFQNIASINVQYKGTLGPAAVAGGVQYAHAQSKNALGLAGGTEFSNQTFRDANSYEAGFTANYAGFQFGLTGTWYGKSAQPKAQTGGNAIIGGSVDSWGWSTGLEYFMGPWVVGGYYWYGRAPGTFQWAPLGTAPIAGGNGQVEFNYYAVGLGYTVAPGLKFYTEAFFYNDYNTHVVSTASNSGRNPNGQIYIVGTSIAW